VPGADGSVVLDLEGVGIDEMGPAADEFEGTVLELFLTVLGELGNQGVLAVEEAGDIDIDLALSLDVFLSSVR
jgi:hypothetical protein